MTEGPTFTETRHLSQNSRNLPCNLISLPYLSSKNFGSSVLGSPVLGSIDFLFKILNAFGPVSFEMLLGSSPLAIADPENKIMNIKLLTASFNIRYAHPQPLSRPPAGRYQEGRIVV